jgi:hypothetical protein
MLKCPIEGSPFSGGIFEMRVHMQATSVTRYSFTAQFLRGGAIFAHRAHAIEATADESLSEELQGEHRAFVVGAIVQSVAALESEISEVVMHGPGHHLGEFLRRSLIAASASVASTLPSAERDRAKAPPIDRQR